MHVALFHGREIYHRFRASQKDQKPDVHTRLMRSYADVPAWWFYALLGLSMVVSLVLCTVLRDQVQLPWWGLLFACGLSFVFMLPISIITATTNQTPGLQRHLRVHRTHTPGQTHRQRLLQGVRLHEHVAGRVVPLRLQARALHEGPSQVHVPGAVRRDHRRRHGQLGVAYWLLGSIENICNDTLLPVNSPWTCPNDRVFFDASVIWGLVGPRRIFGSLGNYGALNWFFLVGAAGPVIQYALHRAFPSRRWIAMINLPVLIGATAVNYNSWVLIGILFNFFVFRYRKMWWQRYNYILSAALDAGVAFMGVLLYFTLSMENRNIDWWGTAGEHCPLASCPTAKGIDLGSDSVCPVFKSASVL
jgi:hypothetical protein